MRQNSENRLKKLRIFNTHLHQKQRQSSDALLIIPSANIIVDHQPTEFPYLLAECNMGTKTGLSSIAGYLQHLNSYQNAADKRNYMQFFFF